MDENMYGNLERGRRYPSFAELQRLYRALTEGCGIVFSAAEREAYLALARKKIEEKGRSRGHRLTEDDWLQLADELAKLDQGVSAEQADLSMDQLTVVVSPIQRTTGVQAHQVPKIDTSHIVGRDGWAEKMLSYLHMTPPKKVVVIQGLSGSGKTTGLKLLQRRLGEMEGYRLIQHAFTSSENKTPGDHLDSFLAKVLKELRIPQPDGSKALLLAEQIDQIITGLMAAGERVVLLLDDAQPILEQPAYLSSNRHQFLPPLFHLPHLSTLYVP